MYTVIFSRVLFFVEKDFVIKIFTDLNLTPKFLKSTKVFYVPQNYHVYSVLSPDAIQHLGGDSLPSVSTAHPQLSDSNVSHMWLRTRVNVVLRIF